MVRILKLVFTIGLGVYVSTGLAADTIVLKNGQTFKNVKAVPNGGRLFIVFRTGKTRSFKFDQIKANYAGSLKWNPQEKKIDINKLVQAAVKRETERERQKYDEKLDKIKESRFPYIWRSLLWPGFGQFHEGKDIQGAVFTSVFIVSILNGILTDLNLRKAKIGSAPQIPNLSTPPDTLLTLINYNLVVDYSRSLQKKRREYHHSKAFIGAIWLLNVLDSIIFKRTGKLSVSPPKGTLGKYRLTLGVNSNEQVSYGLSFTSQF